jgi:serine/threonine protein kinase
MSERSSHQSPINSTCSFVSGDFINKSEKIRTLGSGTFGCVALYNTPLGRYVVKETKIADKSLGYPSDFLAEVDMLIKLRSIKTVVTLQGVCFDNDKRKGYILLEPLDSNLSQWARQSPFSERVSQLPNIIFMVGSAIAMMHHFSFVHNDVKTNNILVRRDSDTNGYIFKLADFGNSVYVTDSSTPYCGIEQYSSPELRNIYISEFWAFMISLIEVIIGGQRLITTEKAIKFYQPYIKLTHLGKIKFDLPRYLHTVLTSSEFKVIPSNFWEFVGPLINGDDTTIAECLSHIGINLNINVINEIDKSISKGVGIHPRFNIVENEFRNKLQTIGFTRYFGRFSKLYNKFLSVTPENQYLSDLDLKHYAEIAYVIIARSKAKNFEYFRDQDMFLLFQRAFLMKVGYQIIVI